MYFEQSDLLRGMNKHFVKQFMDISKKHSYGQGDFLFRQGDSAAHFCVLLKGRVGLSIGETGHTVFTVNHPGEAFGWSSLVGGDYYSASAECKEPTKLLKIDAEKLEKILEKAPADGLIFFKRLARSLGNRLLETYKTISALSEAEISTSFGTGQVIESETTKE